MDGVLRDGRAVVQDGVLACPTCILAEKYLVRVWVTITTAFKMLDLLRTENYISAILG